MVPALSIRQPWAWAIIHLGKDIENRPWKAPYRGPMLVHASKTLPRSYYLDAINWLEKRFDHRKRLPTYDKLERDGFVGIVDVVGCIADSDNPDSPWYEGPIGIKIGEPAPAALRAVEGPARHVPSAGDGCRATCMENVTPRCGMPSSPAPGV
jgi:hypothetical protein